MRSLLLRPLYGRALEGLPLLGTPAQTAGRYLVRPGKIVERADDMAAVHIALSASTGFVCGLGGFLTLPVTLPTNVAGVALLQLHLCASTAFLAGLDPKDASVRELSIACLTGETTLASRDETQEVVDRSAVKVAERGIRLLAETAVSMAEAAGRFSATRFVTRRIPRRSLPLVGGMIGGMSDLYATRKVAAAAREAFLTGAPDSETLAALLATSNGDSDE
jgi:hypothetical protein